MFLRAAKTEAEEAGESTDGMASSVSELRSEILALTAQRVDIMEDEEAVEKLKPVIEAIGGTLHPQHDSNEAAREAISDKMTLAMLKYMPLRGALSFGGGAIELTGVQGLLGMPEDE